MDWWRARVFGVPGFTPFFGDLGEYLFWDMLFWL